MLEKVCPFKKIINSTEAYPQFDCPNCMFYIVDKNYNVIDCAIIRSAAYSSSIHKAIFKGNPTG